MSEAQRLRDQIRALDFHRGQLACQEAIVGRCARDLRAITPDHSLLPALDRYAAQVWAWCAAADEMIDEARADLDAIEAAHSDACRERYWLNVGEN
jgi:hypothetical protein